MDNLHVFLIFFGCNMFWLNGYSICDAGLLLISDVANDWYTDNTPDATNPSLSKDVTWVQFSQVHKSCVCMWVCQCVM